MTATIPNLSLDGGLERYLLNTPPQTLAVGCIEDSLSYGYWQIEDFTYERNGGAEQNLVESIYFRVTSQISDLNIECSVSSASSNWTSIDPSSSGYCESSNPATTFKFYYAPDSSNGSLTINQIWSCPSEEDGTQYVTSLSRDPVLFEEKTLTLDFQ